MAESQSLWEQQFPYKMIFKSVLLIASIATSGHAQFNKASIPSGFDMNRLPSQNHLIKYNSDLTELSTNGLPSIVLIGYWPPTNEMLREFSNNPLQNSKSWQGENWRGLGFNIYSYFPEFPNGTGIGTGDFQVDYQRTSKDFWSIVPKHNPVAVLSFGRSGTKKIWEIEMMNRNLSKWNRDYKIPYRPKQSPPDKSLKADSQRAAIFPATEILNALQKEFSQIDSFQDNTGAGSFLCEYLGYHISWYQSLNSKKMKFGAHTHIGGGNDVTELKKALRVSLEELIRKL